MQLDIFADSRDVMLRNDVLDALLKRDGNAARLAWEKLRDDYPDDDTLVALDGLIGELGDDAAAPFADHQVRRRLACSTTRPLAGGRHRCASARRALRRRPRSLYRVCAGHFPVRALELRAERLLLGTSGRKIPLQGPDLVTQVPDLRLQRRFVLPIPLVALLRLAHQVVECLLRPAGGNPLAVNFEQRARLGGPQALLGQFTGCPLLLEFARKIPSCIFQRALQVDVFALLALQLRLERFTGRRQRGGLLVELDPLGPGTRRSYEHRSAGSKHGVPDA